MRRADGTWACANLERAAEGCTVDIEAWNGGVRCPPPGQGGAGGAGGNTPTDGGNGGSGGTGGAGGHAPSCTDIDPTANPADDPCVIHQDYGIFVSPEGDDEAEGTQGAPVATLTHAIELAAATDKRVYACNTDGDYAEALRLDESAAGVVVFGGFDCDTWAYDRETKARIAPSEAEAVIASGADRLELYDLEIVAGDATEPGGSSIALTLLDTDAMLTRVTLGGGNGAAGDAGFVTAFAGYPEAENLAGGNGTVILPGAGCSATDLTCPGGGAPGRGGNGGSPAPSGQAGIEGEPTALSGGQGGTVEECIDNSAGGKPGATATGAGDGLGARTHGSLSATGWTPANGDDGSPGAPGQGGGGGASIDNTGGGGGGGCGGCGGNGATGGQGGGSSIAILSYESALVLTSCTLATGNAGNGGDAEDGDQGQDGGTGGTRAGNACNGGRGGPGEPGGASGGGAGGLSVGILYSGTEPALDDATMGAITPGAPGSGGTAVANSPDTAGLNGVAQAVLDVT